MTPSLYQRKFQIQPFFALLISTVVYNLDKITISVPNRNLNNLFIDRIFFIFNLLGIEFIVGKDQITVFPTQSHKMDMYHILDPELSSYLLATVIICGGEAKIAGSYPVNFTDGSLFLKLLKSINANIIIEKDKILLKSGNKKIGFF